MSFTLASIFFFRNENDVPVEGEKIDIKGGVKDLKVSCSNLESIPANFPANIFRRRPEKL